MVMGNASKGFTRFIALYEPQSAALRAELERLDSLINDAGNRLLGSFVAMQGVLEHLRRDKDMPAGKFAEELEPAVTEAVGALQFQDLARQLIGHAADRVNAIEKAAEWLLEPGIEADSPLAAPRSAGPVTQHSMSGGSIELF